MAAWEGSRVLLRSVLCYVGMCNEKPLYTFYQYTFIFYFIIIIIIIFYSKRLQLGGSSSGCAQA